MKIKPSENLAVQKPVDMPTRARKVPPAIEKKLRQVSRHFESLFVNQMITAMRQTVTRDGMMPQSHAEKVYEGMLDTEHAKKIAESGQLGLAESIYQQLLRDAAAR